MPARLNVPEFKSMFVSTVLREPREALHSLHLQLDNQATRQRGSWATGQLEQLCNRTTGRQGNVTAGQLGNPANGQPSCLGNRRIPLFSE